jgi:hypothetical protein
VKSSETTEKKKTSKITILVIVLFILYAAIQSMLSFRDKDNEQTTPATTTPSVGIQGNSEKSRSDTIRELAEKLLAQSKNTPRRMSDSQRFDGASLNDLEITGEYTFVNVRPGTITNGRIKEIKTTMQEQIASGLCSEHQLPLNNGILFRFIYKDNEGTQLMQFVIDRTSCI